MSIVGFRAGITGFGGAGWQPCGQAPTYHPVCFNHAYEDDAGRYDAVAMVWRPVLAGEAPRRVSLGAQVTILAGARAVGNPIFSLKIQRNAGWPAGNDIGAGQGGMDAGKPGFAEVQVTTTAWANPGDFFNVIVLASCWTAGDPPIPFPSPWVPGSQPAYGPGDYSAIDNNQFHTYFWGVDHFVDDRGMQAQINDIAAANESLKSSIATLQTGVNSLLASAASLQSNVPKLQQNVGSLQNRTATLEAHDPNLTKWPFTWPQQWH